MNEEKIYVNIWDDFYDDGYIPEGEIQKTYSYVESDLDDNNCKEVLTLLQHTIEQLMPTRSFEMVLNYYDSRTVYPHLIGTEHESILYQRWQLEFTHLTHEVLESLVEKLQKLHLIYQHKPLKIYSES